MTVGLKNRIGRTALVLGTLAMVACSGEDGAQGDKGDQGERGAKGDPGEDGLDGAQGDPGEDGLDGDVGDPGEDGAKGDPGEDGLDGDMGDPGEDGLAGDPGDDGEDGDMGDPGEDGVDGDPGEDGRDALGSLYFSPVAFPATDAEKSSILATDSVEINGESYPLAYHTLARSGDVFESGTFGLMLDMNGNPILNEDSSEKISASADFSSILPVGNSLFAITHFEDRPGGMYLSTLEQDETTGELTISDTELIDMSDVGGQWVACAGSVSPWGSHLGSEEYPPDAKPFEEAATWEDFDYEGLPGMLRYFGVDIYGTPTVQEVNDAFNPYWVGFVTEVQVEESGSYEVAKHYSMGRVAIELAYVMPDEKTAYITDDDTNKGLYMFVADTASDLSAGTLYAAKWIQTSNVGGGAADISWVSLGHATDAEVKAVIDTDPAFSDLFDEVDQNVDGSCPDGYSLSIWLRLGQCLAVKPGMALAASRLETPRYASMLGATMEFRKEEGFTFDPRSSTAFLAISEVSRGMTDGDAGEFGGPNDIRLNANSCGVVYAMDVSPSASLGSDYVVQSARSIIEGVPMNYAGTAYAGNTCSINGIASPDNVTMMPEYGVLIVGEDTGNHQNDIIWAYDLRTEKLTRIQTTPYGAETTSPYWYPDVNGFGYMSSVVQHPYGESDEGEADDPTDLNAWVGYIGSFPTFN